MRFHTTAEFSAAKTAAEEAYRTFDVLADAGDDNSPEYKAADAAEGKAFDAVIDFPVVTPTEFLTKLERLTKRDLIGWNTEAEDGMPAWLMSDLRRLQGHPVSATIAQALAVWRAIHEPWHLDFNEEQHARPHHDAIVAIMATPCTTAGDFMAKAYVDLLGELGSTLHGDAKDDLTGNMFDIDIAQASDERDENDHWQRAAYADLDGSDLGANLLSYGLPHFSAEHWMERADAVGIRVCLIVQPDGARGFYRYEEHDKEDVADHVHRERARLRRLEAFDRTRAVLLADEIEREWPQLVLRYNPLPDAQAPEKAA